MKQTVVTALYRKETDEWGFIAALDNSIEPTYKGRFRMTTEKYLEIQRRINPNLKENGFKLVSVKLVIQDE